MSAPQRLVLARHGQTQANIDRALDTRLPGPRLTDLGREQARALAGDLAGGAEGPVTALHHSSAARAAQTAAVLADALGIAARPLDGVQEVQAGDLEGRRDDEAVARFRSVVDGWQVGDLERRQPGGESGREVLDRFRRALAAIVAEHPGGTLVLVSHGAALRLAAVDLLAGRGAPPPEADHVGNCGRVVLERLDEPGAAVEPWTGGWRLVAWRHEVPGGLPSTRDATG